MAKRKTTLDYQEKLEKLKKELEKTQLEHKKALEETSIKYLYEILKNNNELAILLQNFQSNKDFILIAQNKLKESLLELDKDIKEGKIIIKEAEETAETEKEEVKGAENG